MQYAEGIIFCGLVPINITRILQTYFRNCLSASQSTLKNMD